MPLKLKPYQRAAGKTMESRCVLEAIHDHALAQDDLSIPELCSNLGISRTECAEAFRELAANGHIANLSGEEAVEALEDGKYAFPNPTCVQHVDGVIIGTPPDGTGLRWPGMDPVEVEPTDDGEAAPEPDEWADCVSTWTSTTAGMMTIEARAHPKGWQARIGGEKLTEARIQVIKSDPMPENEEELERYALEHFAPLFIKWVKAQS